MINKNIKVGQLIYIIIDYKEYARLIKGEVLDVTKDDFSINVINQSKSNGTRRFNKYQTNIYVTDKKHANLIFVAISHRGKQYTLTSEIIVSQDKFPELWI